jgi:hypothetical protein
MQNAEVKGHPRTRVHADAQSPRHIVAVPGLEPISPNTTTSTSTRLLLLDFSYKTTPCFTKFHPGVVASPRKVLMQ